MHRRLPQVKPQKPLARKKRGRRRRQPWSSRGPRAGQLPGRRRGPSAATSSTWGPPRQAPASATAVVSRASGGTAPWSTWGTVGRNVVDTGPRGRNLVDMGATAASAGVGSRGRLEDLRRDSALVDVGDRRPQRGRHGDWPCHHRGSLVDVGGHRGSLVDVRVDRSSTKPRAAAARTSPASAAVVVSRASSRTAPWSTSKISSAAIAAVDVGGRGRSLVDVGGPPGAPFSAPRLGFVVG